jgi:hypothetical protein
MPESFRVVEDWPPNSVSIMRHERQRLNRKQRLVTMAVVVAVLVALGIGLS